MVTLALFIAAFACEPDMASDDVRERRAGIEACRDVTSAASWNQGKPQPVRPHHLQSWLTDPDHRIRIAGWRVVTDLGEPSLHATARQAFFSTLSPESADPHVRVRRVALVSLHHAAKRQIITAEEAWTLALPYAADEAGTGMASALTLGKLAPLLSDKDPEPVFEDILAVHPEVSWAFWFRWREDLEFEPSRALRLLDESVGLHGGLIKHWERTHPDELTTMFAEWCARSDPARCELAATLLGKQADTALLKALIAGPESRESP